MRKYVDELPTKALTNRIMENFKHYSEKISTDNTIHDINWKINDIFQRLGGCAIGNDVREQYEALVKSMNKKLETVVKLELYEKDLLTQAEVTKDFEEKFTMHAERISKQNKDQFALENKLNTKVESSLFKEMQERVMAMPTIEEQNQLRYDISTQLEKQSAKLTEFQALFERNCEFVLRFDEILAQKANKQLVEKGFKDQTSEVD